MVDKDIIERVSKFNFPPLSLEVIDNLQKKLGVQFSKEFMDFAEIADFEYFSFGINNLDEGVINTTLNVRKSCNLPINTLFLYHEACGVLLMRCLGEKEEVFWMNEMDFERFCDGEELLYSYDFFPTFTKFFEWLLVREEDLKREEEQC